MPPRTSRHAAAAPHTSAEPRRPHREHYYSRYSEPYYCSYNDEHGSEQRSRYSERRSRLDRGDCFCNKNTTKSVFSSTQRSQQNMLALPPNQHNHEMLVTRDQPAHVTRDRMQQQHVYEGFRPVAQHQQLYQVRGLSLTPARPRGACSMFPYPHKLFPASPAAAPPAAALCVISKCEGSVRLRFSPKSPSYPRLSPPPSLHPPQQQPGHGRDLCCFIVTYCDTQCPHYNLQLHWYTAARSSSHCLFYR